MYKQNNKYTEKEQQTHTKKHANSVQTEQQLHRKIRTNTQKKNNKRRRNSQKKNTKKKRKTKQHHRPPKVEAAHLRAPDNHLAGSSKRVSLPSIFISKH